MFDVCNPTDSLYVFDCYEVKHWITFLASKCFFVPFTLVFCCYCNYIYE